MTHLREQMLCAVAAASVSMALGANAYADEPSFHFQLPNGPPPATEGPDRAHPISQVLPLAMMLAPLGERAAARLVGDAVSGALESGRLVIGDGGQPVGGTRAAGETIASVVAELAKGR